MTEETIADWCEEFAHWHFVSVELEDVGITNEEVEKNYERSLKALKETILKDNEEWKTKYINLLKKEAEETTNRINILKEAKSVSEENVKLCDEILKIHSCIEEALANERTEIGKSVLKQLLDTVQSFETIP